jgi:transposase
MSVGYSDEFKRDAAGLVRSGITQKQVCRDLGVSKSALHAWVRDAGLVEAGMTPSTDPEEPQGNAFGECAYGGRLSCGQE